MSKGIDYGMGQTNIDKETGIRYGIISQHSISHWALGEFEADYGDAKCPKCGCDALDSGSEECLLRRANHTDSRRRKGDDACGEYCCDDCKYLFDGEEAFGEEPLGYAFSDGSYSASLDSDGDVWLFKSPFFTKAQFCSPCAPGACHLNNPVEDGERTYCFGHDWFEGDVAPYTVYQVSDNQIVSPPTKVLDRAPEPEERQ